ncbi:CRISPR-associated protein Cas2 [Ignicoccus pacificus DSM 13166]|uniref:CRISPR-associated endoribonuclease Cas2 n=1 Tax=Ignicoccus pacificus DSM 13166 TaxID=940294 RepID=A0A977PKV1_9CREN|nr:CRISPR-associated protein Cas2 [Ignicoccus pacificus DSM 13166]
MIVVVAYDIYDDSLRDKARRMLLRYGLSRISKSVYAGRINWETAKEIAQKLSWILKGDDSAVVIPVSERDFLRALSVSEGVVAERRPRGVRVVG